MITTSSSIENEPAVSPDGTRLAIAFQQADYDVYLLSLDRTVPHARARDLAQRDGSRVVVVGPQMAYTTDRSGNEEIWLRSRNGEFERPLVTAPDFRETQTHLFGAPAFSPDGQRIAYFRQGSEGARIWISPVAGGPPVGSPQRRCTGIAELVARWRVDRVSTERRWKIGKWSLVKTRVGAKTPRKCWCPTSSRCLR